MIGWKSRDCVSLVGSHVTAISTGQLLQEGSDSANAPGDHTDGGGGDLPLASSAILQ